MTSDLIRSMSLLKFGIREATAFVAHSFSEEDRQVVERVTQFLSKLGVTCDSGHRAEPKSVSAKVLERLLAAELFVGIFTRREPKPSGGHATSPWLIEEKAAAINSGKRLLLFVEEGVESSIGGLQGDYEYIRFNRSDLADALIKAMDYVMAVTTVPLQCQVDYATNKVNVTLGAPNVSPESDIKVLRRQKELRPTDPNIVIALAERLERVNQRDAAIGELQALVRNSPQIADAHHRLAHLLENAGRLDEALLSYQNALDRNADDYKYHRCYGKCLYQKAKTISEPAARRSTLEKARRLLERAALIGGEQRSKEVKADLFLVEESLADIQGTGSSAGPATTTNPPSPSPKRKKSGTSAARNRGKGKK